MTRRICAIPPVPRRERDKYSAAEDGYTFVRGGGFDFDLMGFLHCDFFLLLVFDVVSDFDQMGFFGVQDGRHRGLCRVGAHCTAIDNHGGGGHGAPLSSLQYQQNRFSRVFLVFGIRHISREIGRGLHAESLAEISCVNVNFAGPLRV